MIKNRAQNVWTWTIEELALILLRQFKRLLAERGADRTDADLKAVAAGAAARAAAAPDVTAALRQIVAESEAMLAEWDFSFAQSLATGMDDMAGWDTTADFLSLANEKVNAELRIAAGSALLALLGDAVYAHHALTTIEHGIADAEDVDAVIAMRALAFAAGVDEHTSDRLDQIRAWVSRQPD